MKRFIVLISLVGAASCSSFDDWRFQRHLEKSRSQALEKIDVKACKHSGGEVLGVCMFGMPACVHTFSDVGNSCSDGSQCQGRCEIVNSTVMPGSKAKGKCAKNDDPCGCYALVENGIAEKSTCYD